VPVEGGYRVNGVWSYCSGIPYATHLIAHTLLKVDGKPPSVAIVVVPRAALTVLDDWGGDLTLGMRASGSNSVRITDAFVPAHHLVSLVLHGIRPEDMAEGTPGTRLHNNPMYLGRTIGPYQANLVVPIIGAARAALDEFEETIKTQKSFYDPTLLRADDAGIQLAFGEALASTAAAEAILLQGARRYMELCYRWAGHASSSRALSIPTIRHPRRIDFIWPRFCRFVFPLRQASMRDSVVLTRIAARSIHDGPSEE
jgi:3-hydroxy-9,10-secoandrosta-1,3,5(10)-triene-9,17-dione monooxygenase